MRRGSPQPRRLYAPTASDTFCPSRSLQSARSRESKALQPRAQAVRTADRDSAEPTRPPPVRLLSADRRSHRTAALFYSAASLPYTRTRLLHETGAQSRSSKVHSHQRLLYTGYRPPRRPTQTARLPLPARACRTFQTGASKPPAHILPSTCTPCSQPPKARISKRFLSATFPLPSEETTNRAPGSPSCCFGRSGHGHMPFQKPSPAHSLQRLPAQRRARSKSESAQSPTPLRFLPAPCAPNVVNRTMTKISSQDAPAIII